MNLAAFPKLYFQYAVAVEGSPKFSITCSTARAAAIMRLDLYRFRKALESAGMKDDHPGLFAARFYVRGRRLLIWHADEGVPE